MKNLGAYLDFRRFVLIRLVFMRAGRIQITVNINRSIILNHLIAYTIQIGRSDQVRLICTNKCFCDLRQLSDAQFPMASQPCPGDDYNDRN